MVRSGASCEGWSAPRAPCRVTVIGDERMRATRALARFAALVGMAAGSVRRAIRTWLSPAIDASAIARSEGVAANARPGRPGFTITVPSRCSSSDASTGASAAACRATGTSKCVGSTRTGSTTWWPPNGNSARTRPTFIACRTVAAASTRMPRDDGTTRALRPLTRTRIGWSRRRPSSCASTSVARARERPPRSTLADETPFATCPDSRHALAPTASAASTTSATGISSRRQPGLRRLRP